MENPEIVFKIESEQYELMLNPARKLRTWRTTTGNVGNEKVNSLGQNYCRSHH